MEPTSTSPLDQLKSLNEFRNTLMQFQDKGIDEVVQEVLKQVRDKLSSQVASIFLFSKNGVIERKGINGVDKEGNPLNKTWFPDDKYKPGASFSGKALPKPGSELGFGEPQFSNNLDDYELDDATRVPYIEKLGDLKHGISVPLNGLNRTFGTFEVLNKVDLNGCLDKKGFSSDDVYWLMLIGTIVANFISEFRRKEKLKLFNELNEKVLLLENVDRNFSLKTEVYKLVAKELTSESTAYKACIIRIVDEENEALNLESYDHTNDISWDERVDGSVKTGSQIVGEVYKTQEPRLIKEIEPEIDKFNNKNWIKIHRLKSFACFPLSVKGKCIGTISVYTQYKYKFSETDLRLLKNVAFLTAAITEKVRFIRELRETRRELNKEIGTLQVNAKPCHVKAIFEVQDKDIHLIDRPNGLLTKFKRAKTLVFKKKITQKIVEQMKPYISRAELSYE